jgi:DNA polymerase
MRELHIDFETYSEAKLTGPDAVGPWAYSRHQSTRVLMLAWAFDDDVPVIWLPGEPLPDWLDDIRRHVECGDPLDFQINAFNDFFEYCIWLNVLNWYMPGVQYWYDIAADAAALALPRPLDECGEVIGLDVEKLKDPAGKKLIQWFSQPYTSKGVKKRRLPGDHPEKFLDFQSYCIQDVVAQRAIKRKLRPLSKSERKVWELDRTINLRGVRFDVPKVHHAITIRDEVQAGILERLKELTDGMLDNIKSPKQITQYMKDVHGITLRNAQAEYLKTVADNPETPELARTVLKLRLEYAKTSLAKYDKLLLIVDKITACAYGLLRYHGASTGRWSGSLFQPQNLPRPSFDDTDACIELFHHEDPELIEMLYGDVLEALSSCLRGMIVADPGHRLIVSDFSQIESRMLAWLAGDFKKLEAYRKGLDIYKVNAAAAFGVKYEDVTPAQRKVGKVIELACGYQGSVGAFQQFAVTMGVVIPDKQAKVLIDKWRLGNPKVVSYWYNVEATAIKALEEPGTVQDIRGIKFKVVGKPSRVKHKAKRVCKGKCKCEGNQGKKCKGWYVTEYYDAVGEFLYCKLPSGRVIAYHKPHLVEGKYKEQVGFFGVDSKTKKYTHQVTYGGCLVENITQGASRCAMVPAMFKLEEKGYRIRLSVHDELVTQAKKGQGSIEEVNKIMSVTPSWAPGLPIGAAGYEAPRYKKD